MFYSRVFDLLHRGVLRSGERFRQLRQFVTRIRHVHRRGTSCHLAKNVFVLFLMNENETFPDPSGATLTLLEAVFNS